jgi:hypothetical protein
MIHRRIAIFPTRRHRSVRTYRCALFAGLALCAILNWPSAIRAEAPNASPGGARWTTPGKGVLEDPRTGLQWTDQDNGADIDWKHAIDWCAGKRSGWRLPTLDELQTLHVEGEGPGVACGKAVCQTAPDFHLSGSWFWSATPVGKDAYDGDELAWGLLLETGTKTQSVQFIADGARALCVRKR